MKKIIAYQLRKPSGILGYYISHLMKKGNMPAYHMLIDQMKLKGNESLFEIGYGPGEGIHYLMSNTGCTVDGIDFSSLMHSRALKRNKKFVGQNRVHLDYGDFNEFKSGKKKYDRVFLSNVIYFWDDIRTPVSLIHHMLKKGGKICIYMADKSELEQMSITATAVFNKHSLNDVVKILTQTGFTKISTAHGEMHLSKSHFITARK
ncbi:MAG TPA: class I SAM-dependent methyltransferase [Spirochaetota bacterium]